MMRIERRRWFGFIIVAYLETCCGSFLSRDKGHEHLAESWRGYLRAMALHAMHDLR
jgi:hypothetical protein